MYLAGIPTIVAPRVLGGENSESRLYRILRRLCILVPNRVGAYAPGEYLKVLGPIGIHATDTAKHLAYSAEAGAAVDAFFQQEGITQKSFVVGIAASAGNKLKNWPPERFAAVADHISARYQAIILIVGGKGDAKESDAMLAALAPGTRAINANGRFSIDEFKALIARLSLFISVDTGPIYIAEAFDVPTIDIVGPMNEHEQPPIGPRNLVVVPPFTRKPVLFIMSPGNYDYNEARRQAESITVEQVIAAADELIPRIRG
jgi:ADP-heptose:LPS heptosyltransferase